MRNPGRLLPTIFLVLLAGCATPTQTGQDDERRADSPDEISRLDGFEFIGVECTELGVTLRVEAARARRFVPQGFTLVGEAVGVASFTVAVGTCQRLPAADADQGFYSNLGFLVDPPGGQGLPDHYLLDASSTSTRLVDDSRKLGFSMAQLHNASLEALGGPAATIQAAVDHPNGSYAARGQTATVGLPFPATPTNNWWHRSTNATILFEYKPILETTRPVEATVEAASGSLIANVLGATTASGPALFSTLSFTAAARANTNED
jgi:hypothetical protein